MNKVALSSCFWRAPTSLTSLVALERAAYNSAGLAVPPDHTELLPALRAHPLRFYGHLHVIGNKHSYSICFPTSATRWVRVRVSIYCSLPNFQFILFTFPFTYTQSKPVFRRKTRFQSIHVAGSIINNKYQDREGRVPHEYKEIILVQNMKRDSHPRGS